MIVVDIGNSGLRGAKVTKGEADAETHRVENAGHRWSSLSGVRLDAITKLSWSAIGEKIYKQQPEQSIADGERWIPRVDQTGIDRTGVDRTGSDQEGIEWLVSRLRPESGDTWKIASVNQNMLEVLIRYLRERLPDNAVHVVRNHDVGIPIRVDYPERVGIDRLLAARAALELVRESSDGLGPLIVVQAGTALTVDWVDDAGRFCGGAILPGVGLSLQYLAAGTDQLPWLPSHSIVDFPTLPGRNTEQAIAAGVHAAVVGGAKFLIDRYRKGRPIPVVVSGGDGKLLRAAIETPVHYIGNLVLLGLSLCQITDREAT
jgi:type III pantothenate kinase